MMQLSHAHLLRFSLIVVWLGSAFVSLLDWQGAGSGLLLRADVTSPTLIRSVIWAGSAADVGIGLLLWFCPGRATYLLALMALALLTGVATWLLPALWLEPLGPLLKNLPIAAALLLLWQWEKDTCTAI